MSDRQSQLREVQSSLQKNSFTTGHLSTLLALTLQNPDDRAAQLLMTACLQQPQIVTNLTKLLSGMPSSAAALALLANIAKQHSVLQPAEVLLRLAYAAEPDRPSHALAMVHLLELDQDLDAANEFASNFLIKWHRARLFGVDLHLAAKHLSDKDSQAAVQQPCITRQLAGNDPPTQTSANHEGLQQDADLQALALLFTCIKLLFLQGKLPGCRALCRLVRDAQQVAQLDLHLTCIRNEAAFFHLISGLLQLTHKLVAIPRLSELQPLYICGDSHCLSGAWREISVQGQNRLLVPRLVTGVKIWHLRPDSTFYTKAAWQLMAESIPEHSQVIIILGELDCREGLLQAVEKGKHQDLAAAIRGLASLYAAVLVELQQQRQLADLWVSPAPAVMQETAAVVQTFNSVMQTQVGDLQEQHISWLDCPFGQQHTPATVAADSAGSASLTVDGVHLTPACVDWLEQAIEQCHKQRSDVEKG